MAGKIILGNVTDWQARSSLENQENVPPPSTSSPTEQLQSLLHPAASGKKQVLSAARVPLNNITHMFQTSPPVPEQYKLQPVEQTRQQHDNTAFRLSASHSRTLRSMR